MFQFRFITSRHHRFTIAPPRKRITPLRLCTTDHQPGVITSAKIIGATSMKMNMGIMTVTIAVIRTIETETAWFRQ